MTILTVLCLAISAYGHINALLGIAFSLKKRGHKVVFITERSFQGYFEKKGFEEQIFDETEPMSDDDKGKAWREWAATNLKHLGKPFAENYEIIYNAFLKMVIDAKYANTRIKEIVEIVKPNVIIEDRMFLPLPAFVSSGVPIVKLTSMNPLHALDGVIDAPPTFFHLPTYDNTEWEKYANVRNENREKLWLKVKEWFNTLVAEENVNYEKIFSTEKCREYKSTNLNILVYPTPMIADYLKSQTLPPEYINLDHSIRESDELFEIPEKLKSGKGKLIYFSLGTVAASITHLIEKLLDMFSRMDHRFIASLGALSETYELPDNVWGASYVPQLKVLPLVDLVMTHGGNNTFGETCYFGKPMIVFPMFADQFDNAQRVIETNIGKTFNAFTVTEKELNMAIESLLNDAELHKRLSDISKQMHENDSMEKVVEKIEFVAKNPKFPSVI